MWRATTRRAAWTRGAAARRRQTASGGGSGQLPPAEEIAASPCLGEGPLHCQTAGNSPSRKSESLPTTCRPGVPAPAPLRHLREGPAHTARPSARQVSRPVAPSAAAAGARRRDLGTFAAVAPARPREPLQRARPKAQGRQALGWDGRRGPCPRRGGPAGVKGGQGGRGGGRRARSRVRVSLRLASRFEVRACESLGHGCPLYGCLERARADAMSRAGGQGNRESWEATGGGRPGLSPCSRRLGLVGCEKAGLRRRAGAAMLRSGSVSWRARPMSASLLCRPRLSRGRKG